MPEAEMTIMGPGRMQASIESSELAETSKPCGRKGSALPWKAELKT
jgi:hypothetical protein